MSKGRELLLTLAIVMAAVAATVGTQTLAAKAAGAATARTVTGQSAQFTRTGCRPTVEYNFTTTGTPQGGATQWNRSCGDQQRVHIRCWDQLDNVTSVYNGGWVYSSAIASGQNCHRLGEELVRFGWEARSAPGSPVVTSWIWRRPGFQPAIKTTAAHITRVGATGPFFIKAQNSPVCVKASPNQAGTTVVQGDYHASDCRKMFFDQRGTINGKPYGRWETATPVHVMASVDCGKVTLENQNSVGDLWVKDVTGGGFPTFWINKMCDAELGGHNCVEALAATGTITQQWTVANMRTSPGFFFAIHLIQLAASRTRVTAGC